MFIKNFFHFYKKKYKSPASRNINFFKFFFFVNERIYFSKKLKIKKKNNAGKNDSGKIVFKTKTSLLLKKKTILINYNLRYMKLGSVLSFQLIPFKNKLISLIFFNNGFVTYFLSSSVHSIFTIFYPYKKNMKKLKKRFKFYYIFLMLFQIKKLSLISNIEIIPGKKSQYVRSAGTKSRIIKFDKLTHTVLIELPSKIKKIFSYYSLAMKGSIPLPLHKKINKNKFGFWRIFGKKPLVRGIAMNPVDHPNGGRTKSLKYSKTPWGKTTKYK